METNETYDRSSVKTSLLIGNPGGPWEMMGASLDQALNKSYPGSVIQLSPSIIHSSALRLNEGEMEFAMMHSYLAYDAFTGNGIFDVKHENLRAVASFYTSAFHFVLTEDLGIQTLDEIIDNRIPVRINVGPIEGAINHAFNNILDAYDTSVEDMEDWGCRIYYRIQSDSVKMISDGAIDGFLIMASAPSVQIVEASINKKLTMVTFNPSVLDKIYREGKYNPIIIPGGTYDFAPDDYQTIAVISFLATNINTPDDTVYKMTRAIHENLDYISSVHASFREVTEEMMLSFFSIPVHPGAEAYYREVGLIK
jgi:hypothetical protein